jgi:hypothetical protein
MSRKTVSAVIGSLLVAGFVLGAVQGCGSSSSSAANVMSLCMQGCVKIVKCGADAGSSETMAECMQGCVSSETTSTGGACSNQSAIIEAGNACLAKTTCVELEACALTVPRCERRDRRNERRDRRHERRRGRLGCGLLFVVRQGPDLLCGRGVVRNPRV